VSTFSPQRWWPAEVAGRHQGYDWASAGMQAAFELRQLCALLSVASGGCWVIREGIQVGPLCKAILPVARRPVWVAEIPGIDWDEKVSPNVAWVPPDWLDPAWDQMRQRQWLAHAVVAHHEGLTAQLEHPSLSLVSFISSIEAVSNRLFIEERCTTCDAYRYVKARFTATLRLVVSDEDAESLGAAYNSRSVTVHRGRLHGSDIAPGTHGFFWNGDPRTFDTSTVYPMAAASRRLLRRALRRELPTARRPFDPDADPWLEGERQVEEQY
jgi:hypothetical protein